MIAGVVVGRPDGEVGEPIAVEVPRGQGGPEHVARLGGSLDLVASLGPPLVDRVVDLESLRPSVQDVHSAGIGCLVGVVVGDAYGEIDEAVSVEIRGCGQRGRGEVSRGLTAQCRPRPGRTQHRQQRDHGHQRDLAHRSHSPFGRRQPEKLRQHTPRQCVWHRPFGPSSRTLGAS